SARTARRRMPRGGYRRRGRRLSTRSASAWQRPRERRAPPPAPVRRRSWLRTARAEPGVDTWLLGLFRLSEHLPPFALLLRRERVVHLLNDDERICADGANGAVG